tara:strand:- start:318 stop:545 length:228 start_codon:yes stop_codon:yes gene_type:complete
VRKKRLKQLYPNRHRIIELLREKRDLYTCIDDNGNEIILNLRKHFLYGKSYKNVEYQMELERNRGRLIKEGENNG